MSYVYNTILLTQLLQFMFIYATIILLVNLIGLSSKTTEFIVHVPFIIVIFCCIVSNCSEL